MAGAGPPSTPLPRSAPQGVDGPPSRTMTGRGQCPAPNDAVICGRALNDGWCIIQELCSTQQNRHGCGFPAVLTLPPWRRGAACQVASIFTGLRDRIATWTDRSTILYWLAFAP